MGFSKLYLRLIVLIRCVFLGARMIRLRAPNVFNVTLIYIILIGRTWALEKSART